MSDIPEGFFVHEPRRKRRGRVKASRVKYKLRERDGDECHYCSVKMCKSNDKPQVSNTETIEHVVPKHAGGTNELHNLVLSCNECNNKLGDVYIKCECGFCENARYMFETGTHSDGYWKGVGHVAVFEGGTGPSNLVWSSDSPQASEPALHNLQLFTRLSIQE